MPEEVMLSFYRGSAARVMENEPEINGEASRSVQFSNGYVSYRLFSQNSGQPPPTPLPAGPPHRPKPDTIINIYI